MIRKQINFFDFKKISFVRIGHISTMKFTNLKLFNFDSSIIIKILFFIKNSFNFSKCVEVNLSSFKRIEDSDFNGNQNSLNAFFRLEALNLYSVYKPQKSKQKIFNFYFYQRTSLFCCLEVFVSAIFKKVKTFFLVVGNL